MDLELAGRTAVVTGGSKGIGLAIVRTLLAEGVEVVSGSRTITPGLQATDAHAITVDLATPGGPASLIEQALVLLGGLDILVNNVGIGDSVDLIDGALLPIHELSDDDWTRVFDLHFYSALRATRAAMPSLIDRQGTIINISSAGAHVVTAGPAHYNVSKAALNALGNVIAEQYGPAGVRSITISPGPVSTGVWNDPDGFIALVAERQGMEHDAFAKQALGKLGAVTGRMTTPEEVAAVVAFAASPNNLTRTEILLDGGTVKY
jgi:NAD(P)-dependent dehydrogenase (short-subunit alcohol dehydrogenase family)